MRVIRQTSNVLVIEIELHCFTFVLRVFPSKYRHNSNERLVFMVSLHFSHATNIRVHLLNLNYKFDAKLRRYVSIRIEMSSTSQFIVRS
jgi:hypothetical protein